MRTCPPAARHGHPTRRGHCRRDRWLALAGLLVVLPLLSGCSIFHASLTAGYRQALAAAPYDALIVTGYPSKDGRWNRVIKARVYWSCHLYQTGVARHIIFSGGAVHTPYVESELMALYAQALGVPATAIRTETNALHSCENLVFAHRLAQRLGWTNLAVVSDPIQTIGLRHYARKFHLPLGFLPVDFVELARLDKQDPDIPSESVFVNEFVPLHQRYSRQELKRRSAGEHLRPDSTVEPGQDAGAVQ